MSVLDRADRHDGKQMPTQVEVAQYPEEHPQSDLLILGVPGTPKDEWIASEAWVSLDDAQ